jgi:hypothetical protein
MYIFQYVKILIVDVTLAFSLKKFPDVVHIVFIALLFGEFAFIVKTLLNRTVQHVKRRRRSVRVSVQEGPEPGAVIHGAPNWEVIEEMEEVEDDLPPPDDLEVLGCAEALKPIPPAYGVYRGSVRIADNDIRFVYP